MLDIIGEAQITQVLMLLTGLCSVFAFIYALKEKALNGLLLLAVVIIAVCVGFVLQEQIKDHALTQQKINKTQEKK